jgi:chemotaxis protein MotB
LADLQSRLTELQTSSDQAVAKAKADLADCNSLTASLQGEIKKRDADLEAKNGQLKSLQEQLDYMKRTNTNLLDRLSDLSVINKSGAESIRKSLEALNDQGKYIKDLNSSIQRKDSINLSLVMNLKRSLADINDEDVTVEVKKGVVYISISDKLMFASGSANVNAKAEAVLAKVAKVVNDHKDLDILVEGHTDAVPISTDCIKDNWDLSAKRATSVVRLLQTKFAVDPERMTAGGRGEFEPQSENNSRSGRKMNRRTEIIVTPKLDQFFNLLAPASGK